MAKLRISIVEFLNTAPLVWGFTDGPLQGKYDLSFAVPSQCAEDLRAGRADVGIIPAIEYQRMDDVVVLPGMAVAAKDEVRSILVISKMPIENVKLFAMDINSRSSVGLAKLLCRKQWGIEPEFVDMAIDPEEILQHADAALVIGDPALRVRLKLDALQAKLPLAENCCGGDADEQPAGDTPTLFIYDVAQQWREMTGRPCVLAVWVARRGAVTPEIVEDFQLSRDYGIAHIGDIAEGAALKLELPPVELERYLKDNINYSLDVENLAGLNLYFQMCAEAGLIPRAKPIEFAEALSPVRKNAAR